MNNPDDVCLIWRPRKEEKGQMSKTWTLIIRMSRHEECIGEIIKNM